MGVSQRADRDEEKNCRWDKGGDRWVAMEHVGRGRSRTD